MNYKQFIGIDVSKQWLDFAVVEQNEIVFHVQAENSLKGIQSFMKRLKNETKFDLNQLCFVWNTQAFIMLTC
jgi:transposase